MDVLVECGSKGFTRDFQPVLVHLGLIFSSVGEHSAKRLYHISHIADMESVETGQSGAEIFAQPGISARWHEHALADALEQRAKWGDIVIPDVDDTA
ncbi:hypothetical protein [Gluconacetobacter diazotrophicus]|uniref:Uncharacterized protein n=1 Tax=Gluconacetobacter diazotrophicus TaxID=33996 RepID=A0A7W4FEV8_GLUDI|nr:hypothetical protein [Gluconacetobacter diazotrophicus]MBB2156382.1 hypothetical protein [Gluconacetobacter diazotrophicus]